MLTAPGRHARLDVAPTAGDEMLIDVDDLPGGARIETDVCIVGSGPAGLALAEELQGSGLRIAVLEAGGPPRRTKQLGRRRVPVSDDSDFLPPPLIPPSFGGAANEWVVRLPWMRSGVRVVPLAPIDFERRPWVDHSGWPIGWDDIEPYYRRANTQLGLSSWRYDTDSWIADDLRPIPLERYGFTTAMERFASARHLTHDRFGELRERDDVAVYLNARVGHIERAGSAVTRLELDSGHETPIVVSGAAVVLAGGGLRNVQLLLNGDNGRGIGNDCDVLGRYYMDHVRVASGVVRPSASGTYRRLGLYDLIVGDDGPRSAKIVPTERALREHELLHSAAGLLPRVQPEIRAVLGRGEQADRDAMSPVEIALNGGRLARAVLELSLRQRRMPPRVDAGWSRLSSGDRVWAEIAVEHQVEQAPDPANRVAASERVDRFGRRLVELRWKWTDHDLASLRTTVDQFGRAVASSGIGTFEANEWEDGPTVTTPDGAYHPTGATRMSADPRHGVVDADCRVHGVDNLYVLGSSVFPTGGYANPVLTLIALSIRLGDHLRRELTTRPSVG